jgi:hypothetical protein
MTDLSLPAALDFSRKAPELPDNVSSTLLSVQPTNGTTFSSGQTIQFDLPARSGLVLDGTTAFLRYKVVSVTSSTTAPIVRGTPAASYFNRLDEYFGNTPVSSVYNWNQVANMYVNTRLSWADKYGQQAALGFGPTTGTITTDQLDSRTLATSNDTSSYSIPLFCSALINFSHMIPTGLCPSYRVQLTVANIADIVSVAANLTSFTIQNVELCIQSLDVGPAIERAIAMANGGAPITMKTLGWANQPQSVASGTSGVLSLPYNHRLKSIENLYFVASGADVTKDVNGIFDARDITGANGGTYQFMVGNSNYPLLPINTTDNKPAVLQFLRECTGSISDFRNSMSINTVEFNYTGSTGTTTVLQPSKCYVGVPLSRYSAKNHYQQSSLMSGVDASQSPIIANIRIGSATDQIFNCALIAEYSELVMIDPNSKQVSVMA